MITVGPFAYIMMLKFSLVNAMTVEKKVLFAETGPSRLTVGKIYGGMLILENWKQTRFTAIPAPRKPALVSRNALIALS